MSSSRSVQYLAHQTHHYAVCSGIVMLNKQSKQLQAVPYTLQPQVNLVTREQFEKVSKLQPILNRLVHDISMNKQFLRLSLEKVAEEDDFTRKLLEIYLEEDYDQKYQMAIHRSDYMLHFASKDKEHGVLQQVELNTISSAFGALSTKLAEMHDLFSNGEYKVEKSNSFTNIARCLKNGHQLYVDQIAKGKKFEHSPIILFVVQPDEGNFADQRHYEYELKKQYGISVIRKTLTELATDASLSSDGFLFIDGYIPVSVVYYRSGYGPNDYPSDEEWKARKKLEVSKSINCPSIGYQLAGTKKVQQMLADPKHLNPLVNNEDIANNLLETFTGIYALSDPDHTQYIKDAINNPGNYVLKPQREGGGNLIFGEKMVQLLRDERKSKSQQYILMRRICPKGTPTIFVKDGNATESVGVSELGIFGTFIGHSQTVFLNETAGYLLRTKNEGAEDGGVASGVAVLDSLAFKE